MSLAALRQQLATIVAGTPSTTPGLPTGFIALDTILPGGGIPRGRITELLAPAGLGKTTIARSLVAATIRRGGGVAWIDATRTLDPRDWAAGPVPNPVAAGSATGALPPPAGSHATIDVEALWVVRPPDPAQASWCADLLLRSGTFALVVLDGAPLLPRTVAIRLAQLARESDAALLLLGDGTRASEVGGALRLRLSTGVAGAVRPRHQPAAGAAVTVTLEKGGPHQHVQLEVGRGSGIARRLCTHPEIPDRRGVAGASRRRAGQPGPRRP